MTDSVSRALLAELVLRDGRSLLQYTSESVPWTTPEKQPIIDRVCELAVTQQEAVTRLIRFLARNHAPLSTHGSYPSYYTTLNFVGIDHLMPHLIKEQEDGLRALEARLVYVPKGDVHELLGEYLQAKQRVLQSLTELGETPQPLMAL